MLNTALNNVLRTFKMMSHKEKRQVGMLLAVSIVNGLIQTLGVISIMPFIALVAAPEMTQTHGGLLWLQSTFNLQDYQSLLLFCGSLTFIAIALSNAFIIINYGLSLRFFNNRGHRLTTNLLKHFLKKSPFHFYKHSTAELSKIIFSDVDRVILGSQMAAISILTDIIIFAVILSTLLWINPIATITTVFAITLTYVLVYRVLSKKVEKLGKDFDQLETSVFSALKQAIDLYREIRVFGKQDYFTERFRKPTKELYNNATGYHLLQFVPIQVVELLVFSIILVLSGYLALHSISTGHTITSIAVYAFAAYRIVPVLKSLFESTEEILYASPALSYLLKEMADIHEINHQNGNILTFDHSIRFCQIGFQYEQSERPVLSNLSFEIKHGSMVCIKGPSGIGKSTTLDLLLGMHKPKQGQIFIDDQELGLDNIPDWQDKIGYVPQAIKILDDTVCRNIAFGIEDSDINLQRVKQAAKLACIDQKIESLQGKYQCLIGDGHQSLSGGEKQRIAIARALYSNPQCLILDEASNELDEATELKVLENIKSLGMTTVFVSHKSTVADFCDERLVLNDSTVSHDQLREVG